MRGAKEDQTQTKSNTKYKCSGNSVSSSRALGIIVLMSLLLFFQIGTFIYHKLQSGGGEASAVGAASAAGNSSAQVSGNSSAQVAGNAPAARELFEFDPNTIGADSLCLLGFSQKQAESILKYRSKGGRFRQKSDFARMYVVSAEKYLQLERYICIADTAKRGPQRAQQTSRTQPASQSSRTRRPGQAQGHASQDKKPGRAERQSVLEQQSAQTQRQSAPRQHQRQPLLVDLNAADSATLVKLYGIGGYYADKIIAYRDKIGNFYSPEQLMEIRGIDSLRFAGFAKNVTADPSDVKRFLLDTAGKSFLTRHPYIGAYAARGILLMREKFGVGSLTIENLVKEGILSGEMAQKLWHYVENSSF